MISVMIPPVSDCFMPTLGVAQIAGYLKSEGLPCKVYDVNAELLKTLSNHRKMLPTALKCLLGENDNVYKNNMALLNLYSALNADFCISIDNFECSFNWRDAEKTVEFVKDSSTMSALSELLGETDAFREIRKFGSSYVGISISYESQLIPALLLSLMIKKEHPNISVLFGGSFFYNYEYDFNKLFYRFDAIDVVIIGPGEEVIKAILLDDQSAIEGLEGVIVHRYNNRCIIDARNIEIQPKVYLPDFSDVDFSIYPTEEKAFPYMIKDKCYYGNCRFCNGDRVLHSKISKNVESSFQSMLEIYEKTGVRNVYIIDAALSPVDLHRISKIRLNKVINWIANARFESALADDELIHNLSVCGCKMLRFGLESASQRVLDLMQKGTNLDVVERVLKITSKYEIQNHVYIMFGYLDETKEDRESTLEFLHRNRAYIASYSISLFQPIPNTPIYEELEAQIEDKENLYAKMIGLIYKDEAYYADICRDIQRLNNVLKGSSKTNSEYYSANIFNKISKVPEASITILSHMVIKKEDLYQYFENDFFLKENLYIEQIRYCEDMVDCLIVDLYKNVKISLSISRWLMVLISNDFSGNEENLFRGFNQKQIDIALELFYIISNHSTCVSLASTCAYDLSYFSTQSSNNYDIRDVRIQFSPVDKF